MKVIEFKQVPRGSLVGFCVLELDNGMTVHDVTLHKQQTTRWAGLPGRPILEKDLTVRTDERGKVQYAPTLEIKDRARREVFSKQVWDAYERFIFQGGRHAS